MSNTEPVPAALDLSALRLQVAESARPFFEEVISAAGAHLLSIAVVGSAVTADYIPGASDINSILVLDRVDVAFLDALARIGKRVGKEGVAVPFLMTPQYIERSLDVFPLEFLDFRSAHTIVYGTDFLSSLAIEKSDLRLAAERELKGLLVNLRRQYLACLGDADRMHSMLLAGVNAVVPVMRGLVFLAGVAAPEAKSRVLADAAKSLGFASEPFDDVLALREQSGGLSADALQQCFKAFYDAVEALSLKVDSL